MQEMSRRGVLAALGGGSIAGLAGQAVGTDRTRQPTDSWPQFQGNAANTGSLPGNSGPTADPDTQWESGTGEPILPQPVVANNTVYVGSDDRTVSALDSTDGTEQWQTSLPGEVRSLAVSANEAFVFAGTEGFDDSVYSLLAADGSQQWSADVQGSNLTVDGDTIYVTNDEFFLVALSAADGTERWRYQFDARDTATNPFLTTPTVEDGTVYTGSWNRRVAAVADGEEQWAFDTGDRVTGAPAVALGSVYAGNEAGTVYSIAASDGSEEWSYDAGSEVTASPVVTTTTVYVGDDDGTLYALSTGTGDEQWTASLDGPWTAVVFAGNTVYAGTEDGVIHAFDPGNGSEEFRYDTGTGELTPLAVAADGVYAGSRSGTVTAVSEGGAGAGADPVTATPTPTATATDTATPTATATDTATSTATATDTATSTATTGASGQTTTTTSSGSGDLPLGLTLGAVAGGAVLAAVRRLRDDRES